MPPLITRAEAELVTGFGPPFAPVLVEVTRETPQQAGFDTQWNVATEAFVY
jgi:hypothetical protein